jgi:hypothetical protein
MNTGLQDAFNLGWKLALAVQGRAAADLLDSYDAERRPVGLDVVNRTTHRMDEAITHQGDVKFDQWMQDSQLLVGYRGTRWVAEDVAPSTMAGEPRPGDLAREATGLRRTWVAQPTRLTELLRHTGHTLVIYFGTETIEAQYQHAAVLADALRARHGEAIAIYGVVAAGAPVIDLERLAFLVDADGMSRPPTTRHWQRSTCSGPTGTSAIALTGSTASGWRPTCSGYSASEPFPPETV